jgi:GTP cyclohydrolase II
VEFLKQSSGVLVLINNAHLAVQQNGIIREHGIGISIVKNLGIDKITIISKHNPNPIAIEGFGIEVVGIRSIG